MNLDHDWEAEELQKQLQAISADIWQLAHCYEDNSLALLALLRALEQAHREIRDNLFQASLPNNRRNFYALLKDIEESGGWPYVERMKLRSLLEKLSSAECSEGEAGG